MSRIDWINIRKYTPTQIQKLELVKNGDLGINGKVYRLNDLECLKIFNNNKNIFDLLCAYYLSNISFDWAALPTSFIVESNKFKGYTMKYIDGISMRMFGEIDYSNFIRLYYKLIRSALDDTTEERIKLYDIHLGNVMYDYQEKNLKMIDADAWRKDLCSLIELKNENFAVMDRCICGSIFGIESAIDINGDYIDYYESLRYSFEEAVGRKLNTVADVYKGVTGHAYGYKRN